MPNIEFIDQLHSFFESLLKYNSCPDGVTSFSRMDIENFEEFNYQLFIYTVALFIKKEKFKNLSDLLSKKYLIKTNLGNKKNRSFLCFNESSNHVLSTRNQRLGLNKIFLRATYLHDDWKYQKISHDEIIQAEFILFIFSRINCTYDNHCVWSPWNIVYYRRESVFDIFIKAQSKDYLDKLSPLFSISQLREFPETHLNLGLHHRSNINRLINLDQLGTIP